MNNKLALAVSITLGSFALHCTTSHGIKGDGGMVTDARAETTCCTVTAPTFTKLAEGDLAVTGGSGVFYTPPVDVSAYREIVGNVVVTPLGIGCQNTVQTELMFQEPNSTGYLDTNQPGGRARVDGPSAELRVAIGGGAQCGNATFSLHWVIAGVGLN